MKSYHHFMLFGTLTASLLIVAGGGAQEPRQADYPEGAFDPTQPRVVAGEAEGRARFEPSLLNAAAVGDYRVRYTVGPSGIAPGGGIIVSFPKAWFTNPVPIQKHLQQDDPKGNHYAGVRSSREAGRLSMTIDRRNLAGKTERFTRTMTIKLEGEALQEGDEVTVVLGKTTGPYVAGIDEVTLAIDAAGDGKFRKIAAGARYEVVGVKAEEAILTAPTQAVVGQPIEFQLTAFDQYANVTESFVGVFRVEGLGDPITVIGSSIDSGKVKFDWTPDKEGIFWPVAEGRQVLVSTDPTQFTSMTVAGNPIRVTAAEPETKIYWGDLHSHSRISKDGIGNNDFAYARDGARLDFFASSEHADDDGGPLADGITPGEWEAIKATVEEFNEPGRFVTLLGYECSLGSPSGHHNVYYRSVDGIPWAAHRMKTAQGLWNKLEAGDAITIPHHLGIAWGGALTGRRPSPLGLMDVPSKANPGARGPAVDWTLPHNPELRPSLEIYSLHGTSELYDPEDALAYEQSDFTTTLSIEGKHYARDAWAMGHQLGVIAASDNHTAQPGMRQGGLTAVMAPELTRDAVFDALKDRATYATTGARIILEFEVNGVTMGKRTRVSPGSSLAASVLIAAPYDIAYAEVVTLDTDSGEYRSVKRWEDAGKLIEERFEIDAGDSGSMAYLRVELAEQIRGRPARAWSSPIWID